MRFIDEQEIQKQIERITKQKGFIDVSDIEGIINSTPEAAKYFFTPNEKGEAPIEGIAKQNRFNKNDIKEIIIKIPEAIIYYIKDDGKGKCPADQYNLDEDDAKEIFDNIFDNLETIKYLFTPDEKGIIPAKQIGIEDSMSLSGLISHYHEAAKYFLTPNEKGEAPIEGIVNIDKDDIKTIIGSSPEAVKYYFTPNEKGEAPIDKYGFDFDKFDIIDIVTNSYIPEVEEYFFTPDEKGEAPIDRIAKQYGLDIDKDDIIHIIKTARAGQYFFTPDEKGEIPFDRIAKQYGLDKDNIIDIIVENQEAVKYFFTPDEKGEIPLDRIAKQYGLDKDNIIDIIVENQEAVKYFFTPDEKGEAPAKQYGFDKNDIIYTMAYPGASQYYFTPNEKGEAPIDRIAKQYGFDKQDIIYTMAYPEAGQYYFTPNEKGEARIDRIAKQYGFDENDIIKAMDCPGASQYYFTPNEKGEAPIDRIAKQYDLDKVGLSEENIKIMKKLYELNPAFRVVPEFINSGKMKEFPTEILLRLTTCDDYNEIQSKIANLNAAIDSKTIKYIVQNSTNYVISLDGFLNKKEGNSKFRFDLSKIDAGDLDENFIENYLIAVTDDFTGISINNTDDIRNYTQRKKLCCMDIMKDSTTSADEKKEAFIQYSFGISLSEANRLLERYGAQLDKMPQTEEIRTLKILKAVKDIDPKIASNLIYDAAREGRIPESIPIKDQLNLEVKIIEEYQKSFNNELINVEDRNAKISRKEVVQYALEGETKQIPVYFLDGDFKLDVRVEGAYSGFTRPENYNDYYETPHIEKTHGNCESLISNDLIAPARNSDSSIIVGYKEIKGNLNGLYYSDIASSGENTSFDSYIMRSFYMPPQGIIDNTRHTHNELVEDKICLSKDGKIEYRKPDYAVYIIDEPIQERENEDGSQKREYIQTLRNSESYQETKKMAAQLGIPIVVIDRERMAMREETRITAMKKILEGKPLDEKEQEFYEEYIDMPKPKLVKEIITKFENNANGLRFLTDSNQIGSKYFTNEKREQNVEALEKIIDVMPEEQKTECKGALEEAIQKEKGESEIGAFSSRNVTINNDKQTEKQKKEELKETDYLDKYLHPAYLSEGLEHSDLNNSQEFILGTVQKNMQDILYPDDETIDLINKISGKDYYEGNKQHSIEHIQKVILFSDILAKGENLPEEERKLLLTAAAFHDSGRKLCGSDGNKEHAEPSAKFAGKKLAETTEFGSFTNREISIIQTAIEYHEFNENPVGTIDKRAIGEIGSKYQLQLEDFEIAEKVSMLLKDADALDRFRFAGRGTLQEKYLHSYTAKQKSTIGFAKEINNEVSKEILTDVYGVDENEIQQRKQQGESTTLQLRDARINSGEKVEKHVGVDKIIKIFTKRGKDQQKEEHSKKMLEEAIVSAGLEPNDLNNAKKILINTKNHIRDKDQQIEEHSEKIR